MTQKTYTMKFEVVVVLTFTFTVFCCHGVTVGHVQKKKVPLRDIAKTKRSQIFCFIQK